MKDVLVMIFTAPFAYSVLRVTTPILFAALGALVSELAGVINIGLEGIMLIAALMGVLGSWATGSAFLGFLIAVLSGILVSWLMAYCTLSLKTNVILVGIALNTFASGITVFLLYIFAHSKGVSSSLKSFTLPQIQIPLIEHIPVLGVIVSGHNVLTYLALLGVVAVHVLLFNTRLGLRIRAVGEMPRAVASVGIRVSRTQYIALIYSGILAACGGAYMSMGYVSWFAVNMTSGRGFIALAAAAMGRSPIGTLLASLFFGFTDALSNSMSSLRVPPEFVKMLPYLTTIVGITIYSAKRKKK